MKRWAVRWEGSATMYGYTLMADPATATHSRHWTRRAASRVRDRLEAEHRVQQGAAGRWIVCPA